MTTANFEETPPPVDGPVEPLPGSRRPADYYSSASPDPAFPTWLSLGCGGLALLALVVIFAGGAWLSSGGFGQFMDMTLGISLGELRGMYDKSIPAKDKEELDAEVKLMREHLRAERIAPASLDPFLRAMRGAMADNKITLVETDHLTATAAKINAAAKKR